MKQENNENRPSFGLMKLNNIISYYHMQMPRWLFSDSGYSDMTLESKVAYTFLLNRFQLSRRNGWVNRYGEVYVIYTREDLAREMQISYRKAIACFKELTEKHLVWEQRQGRGLPNRIYLAEVVFAEKAAFAHRSPQTKTDLPKIQVWKMKMIWTATRKTAPKCRIRTQNRYIRLHQTCRNCSARPAKTAHQEVRKPQFKTCRNRTQVRKR